MLGAIDEYGLKLHKEFALPASDAPELVAPKGEPTDDGRDERAPVAGSSRDFARERKRPNDTTVDDNRSACPLCGGAGQCEPTPTIDCQEAWSAVLEHKEVDEDARLDWSTLYSSGEGGKVEALSIVHKLLKKGSGGYAVTNASGFVVSSVTEDWHRVRGDRDHRKRRRWY